MSAHQNVYGTFSKPDIRDMSTLSEPPHADSEDDVRTEDDEVGSLEDFIDDNEDEVPTSTKAVPHILKSNILTGKRTRKQTRFFDEEVFSDPSYRKMMLEDVPDEEIAAALESDVDDDDDVEEVSDPDYESQPPSESEESTVSDPVDDKEDTDEDEGIE